MRVNLKELEKAMSFLSKHSPDVSASVTVSGNYLEIRSGDISGKLITITLYDEGSSYKPVVTKTEQL